MTRRPWRPASCDRSTWGIRAPRAGSWTGGSSSMKAASALKEMMRSLLWLLISAAALPAASLATPPKRVQVSYEVVRDGTRLADVVDDLELGDGRYRIVET